MQEIKRPDLQNLSARAHDAIESGDPAEATLFESETGMRPDDFAIRLQAEGADALAIELVQWSESQLRAQTASVLVPMVLEHQQAWDKAVEQGSRRHALRALYAQLGIEPVDSSIDRQGAHDAPGATDSPMWDMSGKGTYPEDFYSADGLRFYGTGDDAKDVTAYSAIRKREGRPNNSITVYRAIEKDSIRKKILPGDWVTPVRSYATDHGKGALNGDFKIISKTVTANELFCDGNSMLEWGYHPQKAVPNLYSDWKTKPFIAHVARHSEVDRGSSFYKQFGSDDGLPLTPADHAIADDLSVVQTSPLNGQEGIPIYCVRSSLLGGAVCAHITQFNSGIRIFPDVSEALMQGINSKSIRVAFDRFGREMEAAKTLIESQVATDEKQQDDAPSLGM